MKVLHLITWLVPGGIEKWLLSMLGQAPLNDVVMDFCCKGAEVGVLAGEARAQGATVHHCPLGPDHVRFGQRLRQILADGQYDVVHNHMETYSGFPVWVARRAGVPVITSYHNTRFSAQTWTRAAGLRQLRDVYQRVSVGYALRQSDMVTGCSDAVLANVAPDYRERANYHLLYYGVQVPSLPDSEARAAFRAEHSWPADAAVILHVGRFNPQKNHGGLLDVFERVLAQVPAARLVLVGDGPLRPAVEQSIAERGIADQVRLLGLRDDVPRLMGLSDVFLFPSFFEGFGLAALEANAAALPVVASRVPGLTEAVVDGQTALLHDVQDVDGMVRSVTRLIAEPEYARQMGEAGRRRVEAAYSLDASARRLRDLYQLCVN